MLGGVQPNPLLYLHYLPGLRWTSESSRKPPWIPSRSPSSGSTCLSHLVLVGLNHRAGRSPSPSVPRPLLSRPNNLTAASIRTPAMEETADLLGQAVMVLADRLGDATRSASGLGDTAARALLAVVRCPSEPVEALAERLKLTAAGATRVLDRLEARHLARRTRTGADGRSRLVEPTTDGRRLAFRIEEARHAELTRALRSIASAESAALASALAQMLAAVNEAGKA